MANREDNYKILCLRNEASRSIDDLTAEVINSALAQELRQLSQEVIEQTPGFIFNMKGALTLRDLSARTLRQYRARQITDVDLMQFCADTQSIFSGSYETPGFQAGIQPGQIIYQITHRKEIRQKENMEALEKKYREVSDKILARETEMNHCVQASVHCPPDSQAYRDNERAYTNAQNHVTLLKKQQQIIEQALEAADREKLVKEFARQQDEISRMADAVLGRQSDYERVVAKAQMQGEQLNERLQSAAETGAELFRQQPKAAPATDSEFGAKVAMLQRQTEMAQADEAPGAWEAPEDTPEQSAASGPEAAGPMTE